VTPNSRGVDAGADGATRRVGLDERWRRLGLQLAVKVMVDIH
jgi:hypothetical protein